MKEERRTLIEGDTAVLLRARGLEKSFVRGGEQVRAVPGIDLELRAGEKVAVTGRSGAGKSTLLHLLAGLLTPDRGSVECPGRAALVLQDGHLVPYLTVAENLDLAPLFRRVPVDASERAATCSALGIAGLLARSAAKLSRGEAQRVAIARALATKASVLLLDEPTANLDEENGRRLLALLSGLFALRPLALLVATHDAGVAAACDRVVAMPD